MPRINEDMDRASEWLNLKCCLSLLATAVALLIIIGTLQAYNHKKHPSLAPLLPQPPLSPEPPAPRADATVAKDGTGDFRTISEAVKAAPDYSVNRYRIHIKRGRYEENVNVGPRKTKPYVHWRRDEQHNNYRQPERRRPVVRVGNCHSRCGGRRVCGC
ncbi:hypothetical protein H6P81_003977 [Aristolochia fimbriata]|uniref:Pectinesterase catalytic domain-containing protein n=1 Tax=Aristolochia fimbriata TaxID=158543 RepID=A0AAV7FFY2_ARIFI|nr:hypothetical protein H6P81_003977 [Aristolochia fimbriata]